jgi:hypothetical protein
MPRFLLLVLVAILSFIAVSSAADVAELTIQDLERNIDTSNNNVVRQDIRATVVNSGSSAANVFHFALPKQFAEQHLSLLSVTQGGKQLTVSAGHTSDANKYENFCLF